MSTLRVNTLQDVAGTGQPAMSGAAKAWVNFNGTGTVAIRASFNVSSITDNGTGDYTLNFTSSLADANYAASGIAGSGTVEPQYSIVSDMGKTASTFRILVGNINGTGIDRANVNTVIHR